MVFLCVCFFLFTFLFCFVILNKLPQRSGAQQRSVNIINLHISIWPVTMTTCTFKCRSDHFLRPAHFDCSPIANSSFGQHNDMFHLYSCISSALLTTVETEGAFHYIVIQCVSLSAFLHANTFEWWRERYTIAKGNANTFLYWRRTSVAFKYSVRLEMKSVTLHSMSSSYQKSLPAPRLR